MAGLMVSLEGQDGSGKSTLASLVKTRLIEAGISTHVVPEFSSRVIGQFLQNSLVRDKFLRLNASGPSAMTETMYVLSDLYSQDEFDIAPALRRGEVIIKERHIDSIFACQIPKIIDDYANRREEAIFSWLRVACAELTEPHLTVFLRVSDDVLGRRIEARGEHASAADFTTFRRRQAIYDRLAVDNRTRWRDIANDGATDVAVTAIIAAIRAQLLTQHHNLSGP